MQQKSTLNIYDNCEKCLRNSLILREKKTFEKSTYNSNGAASIANPLKNPHFKTIH